MYVLRESILHELNNVRYWHRADKLTGPKVCCERGIVIRTLRITLLSDSGYALTGYEY